MIPSKSPPHGRSAGAQAYRHLYRDKRWCGPHGIRQQALVRDLYRDKRWCGPHGIRQQALVRDLYTCQRCRCLLVTGNRHHPRAAVVNHKVPHKGDEALFFDLDNTESVCKSDHDALIQKEEARGYVIGSDVNGRPVDPAHPWNRA